VAAGRLLPGWADEPVEAMGDHLGPNHRTRLCLDVSLTPLLRLGPAIDGPDEYQLWGFKIGPKWTAPTSGAVCPGCILSEPPSRAPCPVRSMARQRVGGGDLYNPRRTERLPFCLVRAAGTSNARFGFSPSSHEPPLGQNLAPGRHEVNGTASEEPAPLADLRTGRCGDIRRGMSSGGPPIPVDQSAC